ncbi:MAG: imidazole glycerol phosphate synthase subunit HisH [Deltaproteobacteria bacterium]|nr:imidazole glycerol phosphate synthase subunit HisH [Deltaproteobacteria bacterium]
MIAIVDYGLGNIRAFVNLYKRINVDVSVARSAEELRPATKVILPGVGAFDHAMQLLDQSGMRATLDSLVLEEKVPVLGICVGMQILAQGSDEGVLPGLGWISGRVRGFRSLKLAEKLPLPHMGWNDVLATRQDPLLGGLESEARFYFLHSYYFECASPGDVLATSSYGREFASAVNAGNVYGVQFHPEKSHHFGTQLLKNFAEL